MENKYKNKYKELFVNRDDIYAEQQADGRYFKVEKPLTDDALFGSKTVGLYQLNRENRVIWTVLDIDINKNVWSKPGFKIEDWQDRLQKQALTASKIARKHNITPFIESSGFKGYHLWMFFSEPVTGDYAKQMMDYMFESMEKVDPAIEWEIFPKQTDIRNGSIGNLVKAPLQIHRKSGKRTYFVDGNFRQINNLPNDIRKVTTEQVLAVINKYKPQNIPDKYDGRQNEVKPINISNIFNKCEKLRQYRDDALKDRLNGGTGHDGRWAFASVLKPFGNKGLEELKSILSHTSDYNESITESYWNKINHSPQLCQTICGNYRCQNIRDTQGKSPIKFGYQRDIVLPVNFIEKNNCYYKPIKVGKDKFAEKMIATFSISPHELLIRDNGDCLLCDITSSAGYTYKEVLLENVDWTSKQKFLKAIGHQDCTFIGSENDLQALCSFINSKTYLRKTGTKMIGLHDDLWVLKDMNITKNGISKTMTIVPYNKGADAFYNKIKYKSLGKQEYKNFIHSFYDDITRINLPEVIYPILGWTLIVPLKSRIIDKTDGFTMLFGHGAKGDGKTSINRLIARLSGYHNSKPNVCTMKPFPMLKLLTSTNAIPVILDEYKLKDLSQQEASNLHRFLRKSYYGEIESKGLPDQTTIDYELSAPIMITGEWNINQPAIKERVILVRFSDIIMKDKSMQDAYERIKVLPLESFMLNYIPFCLNQDVDELLNLAGRVIDRHFKNIGIAPRVRNNMIVMTAGLFLFKRFGRKYGVNVKALELGKILDIILKNITGTATGFVKTAVDQLIEELSVMALNRKIAIDYDYKIAKVRNTQVLAIMFNKIFPDFKEYARRTGYEGDLLDRQSYDQVFKDCDYVEFHNATVKFGNKTHRCLCINVQMARKAGIDLEGFGIE